MNMHTVQSIEADCELEKAIIPNNIVTAQESKPIIVIKQDSLIGAFLMSRDNLPLTKTQFHDLCMKCYAGSPSDEKDHTSIWSLDREKHIAKVLKENGKKPNVYNSRGILSFIFPKNFNYDKENKQMENEPVVKIRKGVLIEGALDKNCLGNAHYSIIQLLNQEYERDVVERFIDNIQFLCNAWLLIRGFTVSLEDCMPSSEKVQEAIKSTIAQCYTKVQAIEQTTKHPGIKEVRITAELNGARDIGTRLAKKAMTPDNNFLVTVGSGAKGDFFNIAQLTGLLGQQNLDGQRIKPQMNHGKRTLIYNPMKITDDLTRHESRGFISSSFAKGLNVSEFVAHAMTGRESVAKTATTTSESGYIQRKVIKSSEDIVEQYNGTVMDAKKNIYSFTYGQNGFDPSKCLNVKGKLMPFDISRLASAINTSIEIGEPLETKSEEPEIEYEIITPELQKEKKKRLAKEDIKRRQMMREEDEDYEYDSEEEDEELAKEMKGESDEEQDEEEEEIEYLDEDNESDGGFEMGDYE